MLLGVALYPPWPPSGYATVCILTSIHNLIIDYSWVYFDPIYEYRYNILHEE